MSERIEVGAEDLLRAAAVLRASTAPLEDVRVTVGALVQRAAGAGSGPPFPGAALDFAQRWDRALIALVRGLDEAAGRLRTSAEQYVGTDRAGAARADRIAPPTAAPR